MTCAKFCNSTSFPWVVFFFVALLRGFIIHKQEEDGCDKWTHQSYLGTEENAPVIPRWFQPCQCCRRLCYPWEYLRLGTLVRNNWAQVLEACDCLKLLSIYFDYLDCVNFTGVVCHQLSLLGTDLHAISRGGLCRDAQLILLVLLLLLSHRYHQESGDWWLFFYGVYSLFNLLAYLFQQKKLPLPRTGTRAVEQTYDVIFYFHPLLCRAEILFTTLPPSSDSPKVAEADDSLWDCMPETGNRCALYGRDITVYGTTQFRIPPG